MGVGRAGLPSSSSFRKRGLLLRIACARGDERAVGRPQEVCDQRDQAGPRKHALLGDVDEKEGATTRQPNPWMLGRKGRGGEPRNDPIVVVKYRNVWDQLRDGRQHVERRRRDVLQRQLRLLAKARIMKIHHLTSRKTFGA